MNRLVPSRPPLARLRRRVGALPHGLPTALLFTAAVAVLMLGSFVVVDKALPVLVRRDVDQVTDGFEPSIAMPPPVAFRAAEPGRRRLRLQLAHRRAPIRRPPLPGPARTAERRRRPANRPAVAPTDARSASGAPPRVPARLPASPGAAGTGPPPNRAGPRPRHGTRTMNGNRPRHRPSPQCRPTAGPRRPLRGPQAGRHRHRTPPNPQRHPSGRHPNLRIESWAPAERPRCVRPARGDPAS